MVHAKLTEAGVCLTSRWRLTPYNGDYGFCLRSPPRSLRKCLAA